MNNQLLAKVLFTNGLATREQIHQYWGLASDSKDIALVLREQGLMTGEVYNQVLAFVANMDGMQAQNTPAVVAESPKPVEAPPSPVTASTRPSISAPIKTPSLGASKPSLEHAVVHHAVEKNSLADVVAAEEPRAEFAIEGNNPFGEGFVEESAEEVKTIENLQETRIFDFRPSSQASMSITENAKLEEAEALAPTTSTLPPKDWHCSQGVGDARTASTLVPGPQSKLEALLLFARKQRLSDLYLTSGAPIWGRGQRAMRSLSNQACSQADLRRWLTEALDQVPGGLGLDRNKNLRVGFSIPGAGRFRLVLTWSVEGPALAFHLIPMQVPTWQELGIPELCRNWLDSRKGLILVGGTSGSGCSTTLRRLAETAQEKRACLVQVIAEPIETLWDQGLTLHFEPGLHGVDKTQLLREAMRRGDGVLVVEDPTEAEHFLLMLEAAENGMLVIATIEALDLIDVLMRFIAKFPDGQQSMVRALLVRSLQGILVPTLFASVQGDRSCAAFEALTINTAVASLLRSGEFGKIRALMPSMKGHAQLYADSVRRLVEMNLLRKGEI